MSDRFRAVAISKLSSLGHSFSLIVGVESYLRAIKLPDLTTFAKIMTCENLNGVHASSCVNQKITIASPHIQPGTVQISHYQDYQTSSYTSVVILAH